jgi:hypothetical protein
MSGHRAAELSKVCAAYIAAPWKRVGLRRPFFMAQNDTHGGVNTKNSSTVPSQNQVKLSTKIKEENKPWQTK